MKRTLSALLGAAMILSMSPLTFSASASSSLSPGDIVERGDEYYDDVVSSLTPGKTYYIAIAPYDRDVDLDLRSSAKNFQKQTRFRLEGEEYKRAKGHPQPPLDQWYNRKTIDLTCQREIDALLYSPGLVEELLDAFEELLPYYHYFTALCSRGE